MASDPDQPNAQFSYQPEAETAFTYAPDAKPIEASDAETPEEDIDELVGEIKPWSEVEVSLTDGSIGCGINGSMVIETQPRFFWMSSTSMTLQPH